MEFELFKKTGEVRCSVYGEYEDDGDTGRFVTVDITDDGLARALVEILHDSYFPNEKKTNIRDFVNDFGVYELSETYYDVLKDYFQETMF